MKKAEKSLADVVSLAKSTHGVQQFMVWHTLTGKYCNCYYFTAQQPLGYWAGVDVDGMVAYNPEITFPSMSKAMLRMSAVDALPK